MIRHLGCILCLGCAFACGLSADEIVVESTSRQSQSIGDFELTPGAHSFSQRLAMECPECPRFNGSPRDSAVSEMTAGELWRYFESQGIQKVDRIVFYMDVGKLDQADRFTVESMEFRIADESTPDRAITLSSLDRGADNRLVIPGYETLGSLPVARMEVKLDYDFMRRFSRDSKEKVSFDLKYASGSAVRPALFVEGRPEGFTMPNLFLVAAFVVFWVIVFLILGRLTMSRMSKSVSLLPGHRRSPS